MPPKKNLGKTSQKYSEGNTKTSETNSESPSSNSRSRSWCFTSYEEMPPTFTDKMRYLIYGKEICPTTGRQHWQCYTYLKLQTTFNAIKKHLGSSIHFEICKGSSESNIKYCSKEGNFKEFGEKPDQGSRTDLKTLVDAIQNRETNPESILVENPVLYHQYGRTLEKAEDIALRKIWRTEMTKGIWLWGGTGAGKSHAAFQNYSPETHYELPNDNGWWDGYRQQETVIINDFRGEIKYSDLLKLIDKWPYSVPRRGREPMPFTSKTIIITSSLTPNEVYHNLSERDTLDQLHRRIEVIHM